MKAIKTIGYSVLPFLLVGLLATSLNAKSPENTPDELGFRMIHLENDTFRFKRKDKVRKTREDRKFGIQSELGFKTIVGTGLYLSYYPTPRIAVDAGVGLGAQIVNLGGRFRYFLRDARLTPYIGLGALYRPLSIENLELETSSGDFTSLDLNSNFFLIPQFGVEFRGNSGFIIGFNVGYAYMPNEDPYISSDPLPTLDTQVLDAFFGDSLSMGMYLGFSF